MNKLPIILLIVIVITAALYFYQGQNIIENQQIFPSPTLSEKSDWKKYVFEEVGLSFSAPPDLQVSGEKSDNVFILTAQRSSYPNPDYYQLYGNYNLTETKDIDKEGLKKELEEKSIEETSVDGFYVIKGQYKGERNRFVTIIITDKGILTLATSQPTEQNRKLTNSILSTFDFK